MKLSSILKPTPPASGITESEAKGFIEFYTGSLEPRISPSFTPTKTRISHDYSQTHEITVSRHHGHGGYQAKTGSLVQFGESPTAAIGELVAAIAVLNSGSPFTIKINV